nr:hypothetical protein [Tanacetum cinerariifolium]
MQQPMPNPEDIIDPTTAMNIALALIAKAFKLNYSTPTNNNQRISLNPWNLNRYNDVQNVENQVIYDAVPNPRIQNVGNQNGLIGVPGNVNQNPNGNGNIVVSRAEDLDEIEEVTTNYILMANLQQASTSGTQTDKAPGYDSDGSAEEWIVLKIAKIDQKPDNIYTRSEATKKSCIKKQFSSNKSTLKLQNLDWTEIRGCLDSGLLVNKLSGKAYSWLIHGRLTLLDLRKLKDGCEDETSGIEIFHTPLDDDASCKHSQRDIKSKAFINSEIGQLALNKEKQHVFNVLNVKPVEIAFFEFVELVIISMYSDLIQVLVIMPFDYLELCDSDDSSFGVDISSTLPVSSKSIELLTFVPPMRDSPKCMIVVDDRHLTPHSVRDQIFNPFNVSIICSLCFGY